MEKLLTIDEVSTVLGIPTGTLYQWRHRHIGPRAYRVGRHLRYREVELDLWLEQQADPRPVA